MAGPPAAAGVALGDPAERTRSMIEQIERLTPATSGRFVEWDGRELPW